MQNNLFNKRTSLLATCLLSNLLFAALTTSSIRAEAQKQSDFYNIEYAPMPKDVVMEASAIAELPGKKLAISTRRGEIWIATGMYEKDLSKVSWKRFAHGLYEAFGLFERNGELWVTQRTEITKLKDIDGDGRADQYLTVCDDWGLSTNGHEFAFSSKPDRNGDIWLVLCLTGAKNSAVPYRGWCLRITPEGKMVPTTVGIRSPAGVGFNAAGDAFYTDNQGSWNGSSSLSHLKPGGFNGHPKGLAWFEDAKKLGYKASKPNEPKDGSRIAIEKERIPELVPKSVIFPHGRVGQSPTGVTIDQTGGKFGPFNSQNLVGEITHSQVQRVLLEEVNGVYQGAVTHFLKDFEIGIVPLHMSQSSAYLFAGGTNRGWGSRGKRSFGLARVSWTGKVPFEIKTMHITRDGFKLSFTQPIDAKSLTKAGIELEAFTYIFQEQYGSPEVDKKTPVLNDIQVAADGLSATLKIDGLTKGHVHHLKFNSLKSKQGFSLLNQSIYYTINEFPK